MASLQDELDHEAANLARHLVYTKQLAHIGCGEANLAGVATWARDANDNYERLFAACGLSSSPKVKAYQWHEAEFFHGGTYICFGDAVEIPTPAAEIEAEMRRRGVQVPKGVVVHDGTIAQTWIIFNDPKDRIMGPDPFVLAEMEIREFFNGVVVARDGLRITRFDVVEYECYRKGHTHAKGDRYLKRSGPQSNFLDQLDAERPLFKRSNVDYLLLSIVRDIAFSADAERFVARVLR